jgi:two-component system, LytTR family, sensor kinase
LKALQIPLNIKLLSGVIDTKRLLHGLYHIAAWSVYLFYEILAGYAIKGVSAHLLESMLFMALYAAYFYSLVYFTLPALRNRKYLNFVLLAICSVMIITVLRFVHISYIGPLVNPVTIYKFTTISMFLNETLWRGVYFGLLAIGYWSALNMVRAEKEKRILEERKVEYERAMREQENALKAAHLNFLKNQINPHFLFNTLNFIYEQTITTSPGAANGIMVLSDIMRYSLKDKDLTSKAMLTNEVKHLENFIMMHQLRFDGSLYIQYSVEGNLHYRMILPLVLITFVENCLKYGDLLDPMHPAIIKLTVNKDELQFYTHNKKKLGPIESSTGIGIENTRARLQLAYEDRYSLCLTNEDNFYSVLLTIQL